MRRTVVPLLCLLMLAPWALAAHPEGSGPRSLGGDQVPVGDAFLNVEAEDFGEKPVGRPVGDASATGGKAWEMPKYGVITTTIELAQPGVVWVEIRARGTHDDGLKNPHMHVNVNGEQRGEWDVFGQYLTYRQALPLLAGKHAIGVDNFNNYHAPAPDRTLVIDWVTFRVPTLVGSTHVGQSGVLLMDAPELHNSVTGMLQRTSEARNGTQWIQWGIGCFSQMVVFDLGGEHGLTPRLKGNVHDGVGSHVIVRLDYVKIDEYHVGEDWEEHTSRFTVKSGAHVIDICYDNDDPGKKRNLWLDEMTIRRTKTIAEPDGGTQTPPVSTTPPATPAAPWPSAHGGPTNARSVASAVTPQNVAGARAVWTYKAAGPVTGTPAHDDGVVYFGDLGGKVHALKAADGKAVWSVDHGAGVDSSLALDDKNVYVGDAKGWLSARSRADGSLAWRVRADPVEGTHLYGSPVLHEGALYTGVASEQTLIEYEGEQTFRGSVAAFEAATGKLLWRTHTQGTDGLGVSVWSTPALDPALGLLYVGTGNAYGPPAGPYSDAILALRMKDGGIAWSFQATRDDSFNARGAAGPDWDFGSSPVLFEAAGRKLVGEGDKGGRFHALDRATGELAWTAKADFKVQGVPSSQVEGFLGSPAYAGGVVYAPTTARSMVHAFDAATGALKWATELNPLPTKYGDRMFGSTTHANGVILQGNAFGRVFALDAATGKVLANLSAGGGVQGGISVAGDRFFVPHVGKDLWSGEGGLTAFAVTVATDPGITKPPATTVPPVTTPPQVTTTAPPPVTQGPIGGGENGNNNGTGSGPDVPPGARRTPAGLWLTFASAAAAIAIRQARRGREGPGRQ